MKSVLSSPYSLVLPCSRCFTRNISRRAFAGSMPGSTVEKASSERTAELLESLAEIRARVKASSPADKAVTLVAVSKIKPASDILACYEDGQLDFGENYVQELEEKAHILPADIRWHFIGTFQSNKAKILASIPNLFCVQTIGLEQALSSDRSPLRVLIQVNTSGEGSKSGIPPLSSSSNLEISELVQLAKHIVKDCPRLQLEGLMTIGALELSLTASETEKNADFERLKETRTLLEQHLAQNFPGDNRKWGEEKSGKLLLSMGMSSDFEAALKAGGDIVRVGTGIFGQDQKRPDE
ncbi:proline synthetase associated protein [Gymnopilus junonius]|uniref:Pyridoxal phosphate homeostasis protein n=1 Tax=Gymnopilus junonius TaxID=109634 RepID=A0A9P5TSD6_GYMJU|nr:proline synthetase associated protein [Gymnopilus junonius]